MVPYAVRITCALVLVVAACGPRVAPSDSSDAVPMSAAEAERIVAEAEQELAEQSPPEPLDAPADLEAVLSVLQTDRIDLFAAGIARAEAMGGLEGDVLAAQLELSWSEAQTLVARVLERAADSVDEELRSTTARRAIGARRNNLQERQRRARDVVARSRRLAEALRIVAAGHLRAGAQRADVILESNAEHYLATRLAADYYRIREQWSSFEASIAELEERRPDSTGLKFLRGAALVQRGGNEDDAEDSLRAALVDDPAFTRAQVFVLVAQDTLPEVNDELGNLERMSPYHQLVVWTKPLIEQGYLPFSRDE